jgi:hypothetical protein
MNKMKEPAQNTSNNVQESPPQKQPFKRPSEELKFTERPSLTPKPIPTSTPKPSPSQQGSWSKRNFQNMNDDEFWKQDIPGWTNHGPPLSDKNDDPPKSDGTNFVDDFWKRDIPGWTNIPNDGKEHAVPPPPGGGGPVTKQGRGYVVPILPQQRIPFNDYIETGHAVNKSTENKGPFHETVDIKKFKNKVPKAFLIRLLHQFQNLNQVLHISLHIQFLLLPLQMNLL